ncbi:MAG: leucine-rich repeat protein [Pseudobutyrivibrio sp.]|nr:leucine-rich repeat protein [Pseudobutyrivibrio sp.]
MYKYIKKTLSVMLVATVTFTSVSVSDLNRTKSVYAVSNVGDWENKDDVTVNNTMIRDANLLNALKDIINNGQSFKGKDLKNYTGDIDLSGRSDIHDLTGLGYAVNAKSLNLTGTSVEKIEDYEFMECNFKTVVLPEGLKEIGEHAFSQCKKLESINLPESLTKIDTGAFNKCESLKTIQFPENLELLGNESFSNCTSIKTIVIPDNIKSASETSADEIKVGVGVNVFSGCSSLESITFGRNMTVIPASFLQDTVSLLSVNIPSWIVGIDEGAFYGSGIYSIDLSKNLSIESIKATSFANCYNLQTVKFPANLKSIDESAFENCLSFEKGDQLKNLTLLESIKANAFRNSGLKQIIIPENVVNIGSGAFQSCSQLKRLEFADFPTESTKVIHKMIGNESFRDCDALENIVFPLESEDRPNCSFEIGYRTFSGCMSLSRNIIFPRNLLKIGNEAFADCGKSYTDWEKDKAGYTMKRYYMTNINNIYDYSASGTTFSVIFTTQDKKYYQPTEAYIDTTDLYASKPKGVDSFEVYIRTPHEKVAESALSDYPNEYKMHYQEFVGIKYLDFSNCENTQFGEGIFKGCVNLESVSLPDTLVEIPKEMFRDTSVDLKMANNSTVRSLAKNDSEEAWYHGLSYVELSPYTKVIGESAFRDAHNLNFIHPLTKQNTFPKNVEIFKDYAFYGCEALSEITLGSSTKAIGNSAFCKTSRTADSFMVSKIGLKKVDAKNASNLGYIGDNAFEGCALDTFNLNENAPLYNVRTSTFANCQYLESTKLSKNVKKINSNAFSKTTRMKTLIVPDSCTIDVNAFDGYFTSKYYDSTASIYLPESVTSTKYIYGARVPVISVSYVDANQTVRLNGEMNLPYISANYVKNNKTCIKTLKIGNREYTYNIEKNELEGNSDNAKIEPSVFNSTFKFTGFNTLKNANENIECSAWAAKLIGKEVGKEKVTVTGELHFRFIGGEQIRTTSAEYNVNITANPCKDIIFKNCSDKSEYNIAINSNSTLKVEPDFIPTYDDGEITDLPVWNIETNSDLIEMNVADGAKSASITKKSGAYYGTAKVSVTAGSVTKEFYVNVCAPSSGISLSETSKGVLVGNSDSITANITYSKDYADAANSYPDSIIVSSTDNAVVEVTNYEMQPDGTYKIYFVGKAAGTAKIRVSTLGTNKVKECTVNVAMDGVSTVLKNSFGEVVSDGSRTSIQGNKKIAFSYEFTNGYQDKALSYVTDSNGVVSVTVDSNNKKVTIAPLKQGSGKVVLYPSAGTPENNGMTLYVDVNANVKRIGLKGASVPLEATVSVFNYMENDLYKGSSDPNIDSNKIKEANAFNYRKLTNNRIEFKSSEPDVASVDEYGNVKGLKIKDDNKSVTITCTAYDGDVVVKSATCTVTVIKPDLTDISYNGETQIAVGDTSQISIIYSPENCIIEKESVSGFDKNIVNATIDVSNGSVTVSVKGLKVGSTTVNASIKGGSKTMKVSIPIKVVEREDVYGGKVSGKSLGKVKLKKIKAGKKKATVKWNKVKGASGYIIQMSLKKKKGYKKVALIKSGKKVSYVKKKLKRKKTYYFKVRAYGTNTSGNKIYSKWSSPKKVKVK